MTLTPICQQASMIVISGIYQTIDGKSRLFKFYIDSSHYYAKDAEKSDEVLSILKKGIEDFPAFGNVSIRTTNILFKEQQERYNHLRTNGQKFSMQAVVYPEELPRNNCNTPIDIPNIKINGILIGSADEAATLNGDEISCSCDFSKLRMIGQEFLALK